MRTAASCLLCALLTLPLGAEQAGAERVKKPVAVAVVPAAAAKEKPAGEEEGGAVGDSEPVGNIEVTYADGSKDRWTVKGNAGMPRVAADRTVGWVIFEPERQAATASYRIRPHHELVFCRAGKVLARVQSALGFIEEWEFMAANQAAKEVGAEADGLAALTAVVKSRALHGPARIQLFEVGSGKEIGNVEAFKRPLPAWAEKFGE